MIWERFLSVCRNIPVADNFYLSLWFRGDCGYDPVDKPDYIAPYLTKEGFQKLKVSPHRVYSNYVFEDSSLMMELLFDYNYRHITISCVTQLSCNIAKYKLYYTLLTLSIQR